MGRKTTEARIYGSVSSHNDERDERDEAAWTAFMAEVKKLASRPEYAELGIQIDDMGSY